MRLAEFVDPYDGKKVAVNPGQVRAVSPNGENAILILGPGLARNVKGTFESVVNRLDQMMVAE